MPKSEIKNYEHYCKIKKAIVYYEEHYKYQPLIEDVASHIGLSKFHFARLFKEYAGITPKQFLQSTTLEYAKEQLMHSKSILETSLEMGLSSSSRLHELFVNFVGVTPNEYKQIGKNLDVYYGYAYCSYGKALIAYTKKGICALEFCDNNENELLIRLEKTWENAKLILVTNEAQVYLNKVFSKEKIDIYVQGTNFQINVWKALLSIPNSKVLSYSDVANHIGKPKAVRAVATAIASNHIALLIPCHRVLTKSAAIGGYKWGKNRKRIILAHEQARS